jgi:uncharacterized membrane protein
MNFKTIHRYTGFVVVIIFLVTGVFMKLHFPEAYEADPVIRYLFRANHVYILLAGLIHIAIGTNLVLDAAPRRRRLQRVGSGLLILASALLILAFFLEPQLASQDRWITLLGIIGLLIGTLCHLLGRSKDV